MCNAIRVMLSPAEKKDLRKLSGILIPIYASIVLMLLAVTALTNVPRPNDAPRSLEPITVATSNGTD